MNGSKTLLHEHKNASHGYCRTDALKRVTRFLQVQAVSPTHNLLFFGQRREDVEDSPFGSSEAVPRLRLNLIDAQGLNIPRKFAHHNGFMQHQQTGMRGQLENFCETMRHNSIQRGIGLLI
jgi:hypothetical protein